MRTSPGHSRPCATHPANRPRHAATPTPHYVAEHGGRVLGGGGRPHVRVRPAASGSGMAEARDQAAGASAPGCNGGRQPPLTPPCPPQIVDLYERAVLQHGSRRKVMVQIRGKEHSYEKASSASGEHRASPPPPPSPRRLLAPISNTLVQPPQRSWTTWDPGACPRSCWIPSTARARGRMARWTRMTWRRSWRAEGGGPRATNAFRRERLARSLVPHPSHSTFTPHFTAHGGPPPPAAAAGG